MESAISSRPLASIIETTGSMLLRVGVIGLGRMGKLHFMNALRMKDVEAIAVADKSKQNLTGVKRHNIRLYNDYRELMDHENLDAVIISLPSFLKEESIVYAAEKNIDVFVDKPLARNVTEARHIIKKARAQGIRLMTGVNYRYIDSIQKLKNILDEGRIGDVVIATSDLIMNGPFSHPLVPTPVREWWLSKQKSGGGALLDLGYHLIDILNWMFGHLRIEYSSLGYRMHLPVEDSATLVLRSGRSHTECSINVGWFSKMIFPDFNFRVNLHGTVGYESTDHFAPRNLRLHAVKEAACNFFRKTLGKSVNYLSYTYYYSSFFRVLDMFFRSIEKDVENCISPEEQLETVRIIEEVYRRNGAAVLDG